MENIDGLFEKLLHVFCEESARYFDGELDFVYRNRDTGHVYGIEVKAGNNIGKTVTKCLEKGKINFAIYLKGITKGSIADKENFIQAI